MSTLLCSHPVLICNPQWWMYGRDYDLHLPNGSFISVRSLAHTRSKLRASQFGVTVDNYNSCYFVNNDGNLIPAFLCVKCNKCLLCRDKRKRDMCLRGVCETFTSTHVPVFVTLTYSNEHLPEYGLEISHVQKFLKRLRITYLRRFGFKLDLRYLACGEYGRNTHRPHYHLLLWNFDYCVFDSSSYIGSINDFIQSLWPYGFTLSKFSDSQSCGYICKYMLKNGFVPKNCNKPFVTSSRGHGGIGSRYIDSMRDYYWSHLDDIRICVRDKFTNAVFDCVMPSYFRNRLFPSKSRLTPPAVRRAYSDLCFLDSVFNYLIAGGYKLPFDLPKFDKSIYDKYFHLSDCGSPLAPLSRFHESSIDRLYRISPVDFDTLVNNYCSLWYSSYKILVDYIPDYVNYFTSLFRYSRSSSRFESYFANMVANGTLNKDKLSQIIVKNIDNSCLREIF